jgi:hypothetical protein
VVTPIEALDFARALTQRHDVAVAERVRGTGAENATSVDEKVAKTPAVAPSPARGESERGGSPAPGAGLPDQSPVAASPSDAAPAPSTRAFGAAHDESGGGAAAERARKLAAAPLPVFALLSGEGAAAAPMPVAARVDTTGWKVAAASPRAALRR